MNEIIYSKKRETELVILGLGKIGSNLVKNFIHNTNFKIIIFDTKKTKIENSLKSNTEKHRLVAAYNIENIFDKGFKAGQPVKVAKKEKKTGKEKLFSSREMDNDVINKSYKTYNAY